MHSVPHFTPVDIIFLTLIVAAFTVFGVTLAIVSAMVALDERKRRQPAASREVTPASWDKAASHGRGDTVRQA